MDLGALGFEGFGVWCLWFGQGDIPKSGVALGAAGFGIWISGDFGAGPARPRSLPHSRPFPEFAAFSFSLFRVFHAGNSPGAGEEGRIWGPAGTSPRGDRGGRNLGDPRGDFGDGAP